MGGEALSSSRDGWTICPAFEKVDRGGDFLVKKDVNCKMRLELEERSLNKAKLSNLLGYVNGNERPTSPRS
jgi:hypothetical protein